MFLIWFIYYIRSVIQTELSTLSMEENKRLFTEQERNTIKERLYGYFETYNGDKSTLTETVCPYIFNCAKKVPNTKEKSYEQIIHDFQNTASIRLYDFFNRKRILVNVTMICESLSLINELITKEMNDMLKNLHIEEWPLNNFRRRRKEFITSCLFFLKKNELINLLSVKNTMFIGIQKNNIFYINQIKDELRKKEELYFKIFDKNDFEKDELRISPHLFLTWYDKELFDIYLMMFNRMMQYLCITDSDQLINLGYHDNGEYYIIKPELIVEIFEMLYEYRLENLMLFYEAFIKYLDEKKLD